MYSNNWNAWKEWHVPESVQRHLIIIYLYIYVFICIRKQIELMICRGLVLHGQTMWGWLGHAQNGLKSVTSYSLNEVWDYVPQQLQPIGSKLAISPYRFQAHNSIAVHKYPALWLMHCKVLPMKFHGWKFCWVAVAKSKSFKNLFVYVIVRK